MCPIWPSLLYLTNLKLLGLSCLCTIMLHLPTMHILYLDCIQVLQAISYFLSPPHFSLFFSSSFYPQLPGRKIMTSFSHCRYIFFQTVAFFQDNRCLHWVMFYEVSGLGMLDALGYMHSSTTTSNNSQQEVTCFTYMIYSLAPVTLCFCFAYWQEKKCSISEGH